MIRLIYWPQLPGRGEFVRWVLAEAGATWEEPARDDPDDAQQVLGPLQAEGELPHFAPPLLEVDGLRLSQTAAIGHYLGGRFGLSGGSEADALHALQLGLTVMDLAAEAHDTHHPISTSLYYEDQLQEARHAAGVFRAQRLPKYLGRFEETLAHAGSGWLVGSERTWADLFLACALDGLAYAFPVALARRLEDLPGLVAHRERVHALPRIAAYRASDRCIPYNEAGLFRRYPALDETA